VPLSENFEVGKFANQIPNPSCQPSSISHDLDLTEDTLEWFMKHMVNINPSIPLDDINTH